MTRPTRVRLILAITGVLLLLVTLIRDSLDLTVHPLVGPLFIGVFVGMLVDVMILGLRKRQQVPAVWVAVGMAILLLALSWLLSHIESTAEEALYAVAFSSSLLASATGYALAEMYS